MTLETATERADRVFEQFRANLPPEEFRIFELWVDRYYRFQREWLLDDASFAVCNKSRQIGIGFATGGIAVLWGAYLGEHTVLLSEGEREADEGLFAKCLKHVAFLEWAGSKMARTIKSNADEIVFHSGGAITTLPATAGRSFTANVILDEFGHMKQATRAWKNAGAVTMLQGLKLRVVSTPNGVGNEFHNTWRIATDPDYSPGDMPKATWSAHEIPIEKAIEQGYPVDIEKCWAIAQGDKRIFDQEFRCSFLDNAFQYIATEAIDEATFDEAWEENDMVDYFAGLDIGRVVDRTVLIIVQSLRGVAKVWRVRTFKRTDTALLHKIVGELFSDVHPKRLCIDSTGLGAMVSEDLQKKHSQKFVPANQRPRVELVEFTPKSKEALATGLFTAITNKTLLLPMNDENLAVAPEHVGVARQLRREVASIRRVITDAANVRYETPHTSEGHGDHAWALALANYARTAPNPLFAAVMGNLSKPTPAAP